jgi:Uma2 family endonuclease
MTKMQVTQRITAAEYLEHYEEDHRRTELVDGLIIMHEARLPHALLSMRLLLALTDWTRAQAGRGMVVVPIDVLLDDRNVYAPDVLWYSEHRMPATDDPWPYPLPDLAIEIRSPSTWRYDVGIKRRTYERQGLAELWLIDGVESVVRALRRSDPAAATFDATHELALGDTLSSPLLHGFALPIAELFAER